MWITHVTHVKSRHVTHINLSCHTYEWVMSHIWMSHVTHMSESCHTHEWVMSRTCRYASMEYTLIDYRQNDLVKLDVCHCNTLQQAATRCKAMQHTKSQCNTLIDYCPSNLVKFDVSPCNTLQHAATRCKTLQGNAIRCKTLQGSATRSLTTIARMTSPNVMCVPATHCNMLQHAAR